MANNRMYLVNEVTGQKVMLAKFYPSTGWFAPIGALEKINDVFDASDFRHLSASELEAKRAQRGFGPPFAMGGMYGERWTVEYEVES